MLRQSGIFRDNEPGGRAASWTRTTSSASAASPSWPRTSPSTTGDASRSTSSTRPATPTSAARSSACSRWPTACSCSSTPPRGRCRRRASCCARRSRPGCGRSSSSTRSTAPTPAPAEVLNEVFDLFVELDADEDAARLSRHLRHGRDGHRHAPTSTAGEPTSAAVRRHPGARPGARARRRPSAAGSGRQPRLRRLRRPPRHRPDLPRASCAAASRWPWCRATATIETAKVTELLRVRRAGRAERPRARAGRDRRHRRHRGHRRSATRSPTPRIRGRCPRSCRRAHRRR